MSAPGALIILSAVTATAVWCVVSGLRRPRPSLERTIRRLHAERSRQPDTDRGIGAVARLGERLARAGVRVERLAPRRMLRRASRTPEHQLGLLALAAVTGALVPPLLGVLLHAGGVVSIAVVVPLAVSLIGAVAGPLLVHLSTVETAERVAVDLRHQLSAYLDMVTMLLAGNDGHEGALQEAARAGDGMLFTELRRRMREVSTTGDSLVAALALVADDFDLPELEQVAAATALSAAEGAPVARTLCAKCATLRSTLAADQEAAARVRNDKVTPPLVGMALLFMALIIYPALQLT